ncbi:MAG TPA: ABC transporter permease subunit [Candidatus Paceibacterota bacterium]|nr:ABC transporter permease subunit [Candidatus Paceibacterota bacterium]
MIRSVGHTPTRAWHHAHRRRAKHSALLLLTLLALALILGAAGYFAGVAWQALALGLWQSTYRLAGGYVIGLALGAGIALGIGWTKLASGLFPLFDLLQNVPSFAVLPIFVYFWGYSDFMIILFTATGVMWPILFAVLTAIKSAHEDLNDAATIFGARGWRRIGSYLAPLSFPAIITGSVVGLAIGWESVIGAEIIGGVGGIGGFINAAGSVGVTPALFAGILGILAVVFAANRLLWAPLLSDSARHYAE